MNHFPWMEKDEPMITVTLPKSYWKQLLVLIRSHRNLGNKLGWPTWHYDLMDGLSSDKIITVISNRIRNKKI